MSRLLAVSLLLSARVFFFSGVYEWIKATVFGYLLPLYSHDACFKPRVLELGFLMVGNSRPMNAPVRSGCGRAWLITSRYSIKKET